MMGSPQTPALAGNISPHFHGHKEAPPPPSTSRKETERPDRTALCEASRGDSGFTRKTNSKRRVFPHY